MTHTTTRTMLHPSRYNGISGTTRGKVIRPAVIQRAAAAGYVATIETPTGPALMARCYLCDSWGAVHMFALDHCDASTKPDPGVFLEDLALACTPCNTRKDQATNAYPY